MNTPGSPAQLTADLAPRYRIERELGQGGMATVYLAHDVKHERKVALKVLRPELAAVIGADRFLAEIRTTANLQHPHILALFDSGQVDGTVFYVMPFVDGESLRDRLDREKQLPIDEALDIAREVGDAMRYAHEQGVIHRDIKPENILLQGGHALVADFGIALAAATGSKRMTETGMSLGTPTYMSPEQAMGERTLDARTDIYALGCVLYEMLVGDPPFTGSSAQAIVAKVLTEKPASMVAQRERVPEHVEDTVLMALEKLPADRFATAGAFLTALSGAGSDATSARTGARTRERTEARTRAQAGTRDTALSAPVTRWRAATAVSALIALTLATLLATRSGPAATAVQPTRFEVESGEPVSTLPVVIAGAPDGTSYLYCSSSGEVRLRTLDRFQSTVLTGPVRGCVAAAYSPDARFVAVVGIPTSLQIYSVNGSTPRRELAVPWLDDMSTSGGNLDWSDDGHLYIVSSSGVLRVSPEDGASTQLAETDASQQFYGIDVLPGAEHALVVTAPTRRANPAELRVGVLELATGAVDSLTDGIVARYDESGRLVVVRFDGTIAVTPFNLRTRRTEGAATMLPDTVGTLRFTPYAQGLLDVAADGTLYYFRSLFQGLTPVLVDRNGAAQTIDTAWTANFILPRLSPDDGWLAAEDGSQGAGQPVLRDLRTGAIRRLDMPGPYNGRLSWLPGGRALSLVSQRDGPAQLYRWSMTTNVASPVRRYDPRAIYDAVWSKDGRWMVVRTDDQTVGNGDILAVRLDTDTVARPVVASPNDSEYAPALSPDARWLAYVSNEGGRYDVRVTSFPDGRDRWQISSEGGSEPVWSSDGRELFYRSDDGYLMAAAIADGPDFRVTGQRRLFSAAPFAPYGVWSRNYDVTSDGQRFLMLRSVNSAESSIAVVQHWGAGLGPGEGTP